MPRVRSGEAELFYETYGEGPDVVLMHGGGNNRLAWWRVVPTLATRFRVILPDIRGHGRSDCPPAEARPQYHMDDLRLILDEVETRRTAIVCHSMAGIAGLRLAQSEPERVRSLVLCASPAVRTSETLEAFRTVEQVLSEPESRRQMTDRAFAPGFQERAADIVFLYERLNELNPQFPRDVLMPGLRQTAVPPEELEPYDVPTLVVAGGRDQMLPPATLARVAEHIPGASLTLLDGVGHTPFLEDPDSFLASINPWLETC